MKALLVLVILGIGALCWWLAGPVGLAVGLVVAVALTAQQWEQQGDDAVACGLATLALVVVCALGVAALVIADGWR